MILAVLFANSEGNILVERLSFAIGLVDERVGIGVCVCDAMFNGVPAEERLHWRSFLVKLGADNLKGVKNEELLVASHKSVYIVYTVLGDVSIFVVGKDEYDELALAEVIFAITSAVKDVCGKIPSERLFLDKYGKICLCLDEIVWKYGKQLRDEVERSIPEWRGEVISYKRLKIQLNSIENLLDSGRFDVGFTRLLNNELDKVNRFYIDKEEDYVIRLKELQNRASNLECRTEMLNLQKDILDFHKEMVLLLHYTFLNSTGFIKIVKKHNKRAGVSIQLSFMPRVLEQPFFSTDLLYNLMTECQAMLHRLFLDDEP
ncbi:hypothetical protein EZV62_004264 [Acer yangbiense]|uniref:SPX domain-containing protein n=1 Tax=Acer yangbiense TaxID=1000413 RepID=A0A5C7IJS2_9ROSI|nr:hypothetical protein EZV62_004264 [Acer yangbiense]